MPYEAIPLFTSGMDTLYNVVPPTSLMIHPVVGNDLGNLSGKNCVAFFWAEMMDTHQIPGNFEIVTCDRAVLLPAPGSIGRPIFFISLLHKGAMLIIWEVLYDHISNRSQE